MLCFFNFTTSLIEDKKIVFLSLCSTYIYIYLFTYLFIYFDSTNFGVLICIRWFYKYKFPLYLRWLNEYLKQNILVEFWCFLFYHFGRGGESPSLFYTRYIQWKGWHQFVWSNIKWQVTEILLEIWWQTLDTSKISSHQWLFHWKSHQ